MKARACIGQGGASSGKETHLEQVVAVGCVWGEVVVVERERGAGGWFSTSLGDTRAIPRDLGKHAYSVTHPSHSLFRVHGC